MGFNLTMLKMSPDFFNDTAQESIAAQTDRFANAFVPNMLQLAIML